MKPQIDQLIEYISQYRTFDEVKTAAYVINPNWRESSWTRALRRRQGQIKPVLKNNQPNSPIIAYEPKKVATGQISPNLTLIKSGADRDNALRAILAKIRPTWDSQAEIKKLQEAIKSRSDYLKITTIKKYGGAGNSN